MIKVYDCPKHGSIADDLRMFDVLWHAVGCPICYVLNKGGNFGKNIEPVFEVSYGQKADARIAVTERLNPDDLEGTCTKCKATLYYRPYGPTDLPFYCYSCAKIASLDELKGDLPEGQTAEQKTDRDQ